MKSTEKKQTIKTLPDGIWESSPPEFRHTNYQNDITTDLQGNGYPVEASEKESDKNKANDQSNKV